jgi:hypothetical protein
MHENMLNTVIHTINNWKNVKKRTKKQKRRNGRIDHIDNSICFYDGRSAEIGTTLYQNPNMMHACRVVCIRAKQPGTLGLREDDFDYFAWLTNIGEHEMSSKRTISTILNHKNNPLECLQQPGGIFHATKSVNDRKTAVLGKAHRKLQKLGSFEKRVL